MLPPIKRLDCPFHMGDFEENRQETLMIAMERHVELNPQLPFEDLTSEEKADFIHGVETDRLRDEWLARIDTFLSLELDYLRLDVTSCRCQAGCCRFDVYVLGMLRFSAPVHPKRLEIFGALERDQDRLRQTLERNNIPKEDIFFVDSPGYEGTGDCS